MPSRISLTHPCHLHEHGTPIVMQHRLSDRGLKSAPAVPLEPVFLGACALVAELLEQPLSTVTNHRDWLERARLGLGWKQPGLSQTLIGGLPNGSSCPECAGLNTSTVRRKHASVQDVGQGSSTPQGYMLRGLKCTPTPMICEYTNGVPQEILDPPDCNNYGKPFLIYC